MTDIKLADPRDCSDALDDRALLIWLYTRMVLVYGEPPESDYMVRFKALARAVPEGCRRDKLVS